MSEPRSHRILGVVYFNPDDSRVFVPRRNKLGWELNFGHSRAVAVLAWICTVSLLILVAAPVIAHPLWFACEPTDMVWWFLAILTAAGLVRLNTCFAWRDYREISLASFGILAAGVGFAMQGLINTPLMLWWGNTPAAAHHLVFGSVAAVAQTFGKWFALSLLIKVRPPASPSQCFRYGLLTGLGFTVLEISMLYFRVAWAQLTVDYLGLWERASASAFHIYSAGLIAAAIGSRRYWPVGVAVGTHAVMDFLAGAGRILGLSIYSLEITFSVCAVFVWVAFLLKARADSG